MAGDRPGKPVYDIFSVCCVLAHHLAGRWDCFKRTI